MGLREWGALGTDDCVDFLAGFTDCFWVLEEVVECGCQEIGSRGGADLDGNYFIDYSPIV